MDLLERPQHCIRKAPASARRRHAELVAEILLCSANIRSDHCGRQKIPVMQVTQQRSGALRGCLPKTTVVLGLLGSSGNKALRIVEMPVARTEIRSIGRRYLTVHHQLGDDATNFAWQEWFFNHGTAALGDK